MADKKIEIHFAPGALDDFEGTQEELDALMAEIQAMADSGKLFENARQLTEEEAEEIYQELERKGPRQ